MAKIFDTKVMSLAEAIERFVHPHCVVHAAYSDARPNAALMQLVRRFASVEDPALSLVTAGMVSVQHSLVELGIVNKVAASFVGENYPSARPNAAFIRALEAGRVTLTNWSMWALTARLVAGALGVPHFPVRSLAGSSMADDLRGDAYDEVVDPFTGERVGVVAALRPDIVLLHGVAADRHGNVVMSAPYGESHWGALAARDGVIATVEKLVDEADIRANNALTKVPAHVVRAVCVVPLGSHPYGMYNPGFPGVAGYVEDHDFIGEVYRAARDERTFRDWIAEWITGTPDHDAYLAKLGSERIHDLHSRTAAVRQPPPRVAPARPAAADPKTRSAGSGAAGAKTWTSNEFQVITASRRIRERVTARGYDAVLAGVGLANLASWLAVADLKNAGQSVQLMAEIGMFGYVPAPGEPFIFAHQNLPTCTVMSDVAGVLGTFVSGPGTKTLGVLGAGQVDGHGNTNSTYDESGRFIVGSGGANDIASGADEVLLTVAHRRDRLVAALPYITCPGVNVGSIVTSRAVFERDGDGFRLVRYLARSGLSERDIVMELRATCGWEFELSADLSPEAAPTVTELKALRSYDPESIFTRRPRTVAAAGGPVWA
jgi:acyl CoA:acetate/3-ketoacid CoA transferase alpha subunit/acyl CoA:acetate/3-ketoacid CoA transferase beta subunit